MTDIFSVMVREEMVWPPSDSVPLTGYRSDLADVTQRTEFHLMIFSLCCEKSLVTRRGKLFSSFASPGHLETETMGASNPGVRVFPAAPARVGGLGWDIWESSVGQRWLVSVIFYPERICKVGMVSFVQGYLLVLWNFVSHCWTGSLCSKEKSNHFFKEYFC